LAGAGVKVGEGVSVNVGDGVGCDGTAVAVVVGVEAAVQVRSPGLYQ